MTLIGEVMSKLFMLFVCFGFLVISGCSREVETSELVGNYLANHGRGIDELEIKADGTYLHTYKSSLEGDETAFSYTESWALVQDSNRIVLNHYIQGWPWRPGTEVDMTPRNMNTFVKRSLFSGKVKILIDVDSNYYYKKQE